MGKILLREGKNDSLSKVWSKKDQQADNPERKVPRKLTAKRIYPSFSL